MTDLRQAAQQALEALENSSPDQYPEDAGVFYDAITALRTALEQQAEPVVMRMPKLGDRVICLEDESLGTVESLTAGGSPDIAFDDGSRGTYMLREFAELFSYVAPPQQQAEPWCMKANGCKTMCGNCPNFTQPQQQAEPVAWAVQACSKMWRGEFAEIDSKAEAKRIGGTCVAYALYTTPPQRQWVGLTDEDVNRESAPIAQQMKLAFHAGMYVAQQILKERNNG
jgi:hypothetical protein